MTAAVDISINWIWIATFVAIVALIVTAFLKASKLAAVIMTISGILVLGTAHYISNPTYAIPNYNPFTKVQFKDSERSLVEKGGYEVEKDVKLSSTPCSIDLPNSCNGPTVNGFKIKGEEEKFCYIDPNHLNRKDRQVSYDIVCFNGHGDKNS